MIVDGAAIGQAGFEGDVSDPRRYLLACYPAATIAPLDHVVLTAEPLVARVNHGVWIASCTCGAPPRPDRPGMPNPGCVVFLEIPLGWCVRCGNRPWGGGWRRIIVPPPEQRRAIESVLELRPNVGDRNWEPGETLADLVAQNIEHGDPIPPPPDGKAPVPDGPRPSRFPSPSAMAAVLRKGVRRGLRYAR